MRTVLSYTGFWLVLLLVAMGNGVLRERVFSKALPELCAQHRCFTIR
jgi:hypothetical protein